MFRHKILHGDFDALQEHPETMVALVHENVARKYLIEV